jgi:hypothetical protein
VLSTVDNTPTVEICHKLKAEYGPFDVAQIQFNAAGAYPACFDNLRADDKSVESFKQVERNLSHMVAMAKALGAYWTQPFAGAYILGGKLWDKNRHLGTPRHL